MEMEKTKPHHHKVKALRIPPPVANPIPTKTFTLHGKEVWDDYSWLKDKNNPKVMKYLEDENRYADAEMQHTKDLQTALYNEFVSRSLGDDRTAFVQIDDWFYYNRTEAESQYTIHCRRWESLDSEEQVILNENIEAEGEDYYCLGVCEVSHDHRLLACGIDTTGDERFTLKFKDLQTSQWLEDEIYPVGWSAAWAADNATIFYTQVDEIGRSYRLYRHTLGENATDGSDDELIYEETDPLFVLLISVTANKKYLLLHVNGQITSETWFLPSNQPKGQFQLISKRQRGVMYSVHSHGSYFYIRTNENAKNFKVVTCHVDDPSNKEQWEEFLPEREDVLIEKIELFRHHFVTWEWHNGLQKIRVQDLSDGGEPTVYSIWPAEFKEDGNLTHWTCELISVAETPVLQYFNSNILHFTYTSFLQPHIVYEYDMDNRRKRKAKERTLPGYIKDHYHEKRIFATAADGAQIPISLVYKISLKNQAEGNPLLLCGYGAYGGFKLPEFSAERLSLLDRGIIFAIAHIRGDATMGTHWYEQGKYLNKKNTITDFIACAEHLISEGYTTASKLAMHGRSAGGLLLAAVNMRPDLFKVVLSDVPFVDVSSLFDPKVPWTVFEYEEWGNPADPEVFDYLMSYSPYHNIEDKEYPHMLITAGLNDPRVSYSEPAKFVAKLRKMKQNTSTLLLKTYLHGHMGASDMVPLLKMISSPVAIAPPSLLAMFQGYQVTKMLFSALELGVFTHLHKQPNFKADIETLASAIGIPARGLIRLMDALVSVGLLGKEEDAYILTELAVTHLVEGVPGFIGDMRNTMCNDYQWKAVGTLTDALRQGEALEELPSSEALRIMESNAASQMHAAAVLEAAISPWLSRRKTLYVLTLGCGNGVLGFSLVKKRKNSKVWSMDYPGVISIAKKFANEMQIPNELVEFIEVNNLAEATFTSNMPYDLIIVGQNMFNTLGSTKAAAILQQASEALKTNGRLVLYETLSGNEEESPYAALTSLTMFATRKKGKVHPLSWFNDLLSTTGFVEAVVNDLLPFPEKLLITYKNIIAKGQVKKKQN